MHERVSENDFLREEAKFFAGLQSKIVSLFDYKEKINYTHESDALIFQKNSPFLFISNTTSSLRGLGSPHVSFTHYPSDQLDNYGGQLGIQADSFLYTGLHTDEATREQVADFIQQDENLKQFVGSYYFFNHQGDYAKVVKLPSLIDDNRPALSEGKAVKVVEGEVYSSELELVGFILNDLYKKTKVALEELN